MSTIQSYLGRNTNSDLLYYLLGVNHRKAVKPTIIQQPDFIRFDCCTKTAPAMSEEKYREAIVKQAQMDAAAGKFGDEYSKGYRNLKKSFVSVSSPDRKSIIAGVWRALSGRETVTFAEFKDRRVM